MGRVKLVLNDSRNYWKELYPVQNGEVYDYKEFINHINQNDEKLYSDLMEKMKELCWNYKNKLEKKPAVLDVYKIYKLINSIINSNYTTKEIDTKFFSEDEDPIKEFIANIINENNNDEFTDIEVDIVKGSIYKIKKYFLENNKIKDIRGGSTIIDYLNIELVKQKLAELNLNEENLIYSGGGNIFLVVPKGNGAKICENLEKAFTEISLTAMNAFEYITVTLNDLAFNFKSVSSKVTRILEDRKKIKIYKINPDNNLKKIMKDNKPFISWENYKENKELIDKKVVCELCNIRDAKYKINEAETIAACPSCLRKHIAGKKKSLFFSEYEKFINKNMKYKNEINTLKDISEDIAIIYGDGNNMGKIVMQINNVFEMMYFSRKTDETTKKSVYKAIYDVMGTEARFEVIALGGDDIFIIVPAKYAIEITTKIIDNFNSKFNDEITMSASIIISNYNTPISSTFKIAQDKLKSAKKILRNNEAIKDGSIDLIEIIGSSNLVESDNIRLFPKTNKDFKKIVKLLREFKEKDEGKTQIHKMSYAQKNMEEQEFELFFHYQESRNNNSLKKLIIELTDIKKENFSAINAPWDDLIMLWDWI